jgi:hypothetical protein
MPVPALGAWGCKGAQGRHLRCLKSGVLPITLDPDIDDFDMDDWTTPTPPPSVPAPRRPWDQLTMAICDHCRQPVGEPRLITIGSTKDPAYRARVCPSSLKVLRSEGLTDLYAL